jgi:hypothetical protein
MIRNDLGTKRSRDLSAAPCRLLGTHRLIYGREVVGTVGHWVSRITGNAGIPHDLCTDVLVSLSIILLATCYPVAIHLGLCSMLALCGSPGSRDVG